MQIYYLLAAPFENLQCTRDSSAVSRLAHVVTATVCVSNHLKHSSFRESFSVVTVAMSFRLRF